jgi:predicted metal-dependent phosphoesterase TrpH
VAIDLHLHSNKSDGSDSPAEIVRLARQTRLTAIALTDHDNLDGIPEARAAAEEAGIQFISGTELSVNWSGDAMHLLVYFLDPGPGPLQDKLAAVQAGRESRNRRLITRLLELGIELTYEEVVAEADGSGIGRPHFAALLVRKEHAESIQDAFDLYLATGRPAYVPRERLEAFEAISLARESGAVPVVAHPHTLEVPVEGYAEAFGGLVDAGLGGIESYYGGYDYALTRSLVDLCKSFGIVATGGSDYHGTYKAGLSVGIGPGDLVVPDHALSDLEAERDRVASGP